MSNNFENIITEYSASSNEETFNEIIQQLNKECGISNEYYTETLGNKNDGLVPYFTEVNNRQGTKNVKVTPSIDIEENDLINEAIKNQLRYHQKVAKNEANADSIKAQIAERRYDFVL